MLRIILDNDNAALARGAVRLLALPGTDPLLADTLVVGQMGVGAWIEQQLAREVGVSANLRIELPGRFLWRIVQTVVSGIASRPPFDPMIVRWAILDALDSLPAAADFDVIRDRWQQASGRDRMSLATELGQLFERYLAYRREWLDRWSRDNIVAPRPDTDLLARGLFESYEPWQRWLWQQVLARMDGLSESHPFDEFAHYVRRGKVRPTGAAAAFTGPDSPQRRLFNEQGAVVEPVDGPTMVGGAADFGRIIMVGLLDIPAEQMNLLALLGELTDIVWFTNDPAQGFWEDLVSEKQAAKIALELPEAGWLYDAEPAILGEWGRQQRDFLAAIRILEGEGRAEVIDESLRNRNVEPALGLLQTIQSAVFTLSDVPWIAFFDTPMPTDRLREDVSLQVHSCHSLMRQVETVHDSLLAAFDDIPDLQAGEVAVFCCDLTRAAPLVNAVFGTGGLASLPVRVIGQVAEETPQVRAFELFISLVEGPAHITAVLAFLNCEVVRQVCHLDDALLARLQSALEQAGAQRDDLTSNSKRMKHGWQLALQRLVLSGFTGSDDNIEPIAGLLPAGQFDSTLATAVGHVVSLLDDIRILRRGTASTDFSTTVHSTDNELSDHSSRGLERASRRIDEWVRLLTDWTDRWLVGYGPSRDGLYRVRDALSQLTESTNLLTERVRNRAVAFDVLAQALRQQLAASGSAARPSGAITVAPFGSLRQVPFRVCAVIGLDQGQWPNPSIEPEYDLMRGDPRFGDRSNGQQARGTFLDVILDTSDRLIFAYTGRDDRTNQPCNPARVITELSDYVAARCRAANLDFADDHVALVVHHPLQPFSIRRFKHDALRSYARPWFNAAAELADVSKARQVIGPLERDDGQESLSAIPDVISVTTLTDAYLNPARYLMRHRGAINISRTETQPGDIEPLEQTDLGRFDAPELLASALLMFRHGRDISSIRAWLRAHPLLPDGAIADLQAAELIQDMQALLTQQKLLLEQLGSPQPADPQQIGVRVAIFVPQRGEILVTGRLDPVYRHADGSLLQLLPPIDQVQVADVLQLWHQHLLLVGSDLTGASTATTVRLVGKLAAGMKANYLALTGTPGFGTASQALTQSIQTYGDICSRPYALFPKTAGAWLRKSLSLDIDAAEYPVPIAARLVFEDREGRWPAESQKPWSVAFWRDSPPRFEDALRDSLAVYGPLWQAAVGQTGDTLSATDNIKTESLTDDSSSGLTRQNSRVSGP